MLSLERASDSIYWFDRSARIAWANDTACRSLGYTLDELLGLSIAEINPTYPAQTARRTEELAASVGAGSEVLPPGLTMLAGGLAGQTYETVHRRKDGRLVPVEVSAAPIVVGERRYLVAAVRDISSRRWMESALQNMASELDRFFEVTLEMLCITDQRGTFRRLNPAWERVLGFAPAELLSRPQIDFVHPDDRAATLDALQRLGSQGSVSSFSNRFQKKSGGYCWLQWRCATDGEKIYAAVYDANARMALEEPPRADADPRAWPALPGGAGGPAPAATGIAAPAAPHGAPEVLVLVVDDNRLNQRVARQMLEHFGIRVETAGDGREALAAMRRGPGRFDAILMDMQMPDMDGLQATRAIREEFPKQAVPIIAATASIDGSDMTACLDAGMNDYVSKPIEPLQLERVLSRWLAVPSLTSQAPRPEQQAEQPVGLGGHDSADALMAVRGVDVAAALIRLNGQHDLLVRLLRVFAQEHGSATADIGAAIAEKDFEGALGVVHNLRGVAGTLSATDVFDAARALERGLRNGEHGLLGEQLERLRVALDAVCRSIRESTGEATVVRADESPHEPDRPMAGALLAEFDVLLKMRRFSARQRFEQLKQQLTLPELAATVERVQRALDELEFEQARSHLPAIAETLGVPFRHD
jgi:PAS domain S-box-containing protein